MDYDYVNIKDDEWTIETEIEIPEEEFELESAVELYQEVKDESIESILEWYDENID